MARISRAIRASSSAGMIRRARGNSSPSSSSMWCSMPSCSTFIFIALLRERAWAAVGLIAVSNLRLRAACPRFYAASDPSRIAGRARRGKPEGVENMVATATQTDAAQRAIARHKYEIVDADAHTFGPKDMWERWLPREFQDRRPRLVK